MKDIELKITEDALQALFQGKKVVFDNCRLPGITLYPPRYGVFMTHDKYELLVRKAQMEGTQFVVEMLEQLRES